MPIPPDDEITKRYYSIGEVADLFEVSKSLIRFWESEFELLKPHKNSKGERRFTPENIEQFKLIYELVKERGFTLSGAKLEIERQKKWDHQKTRMLKSLQKIRRGLENIKKEI